MKRIFAILFSLAFAFNVYAADIKISELPVVTSVTPATDVVPVVASGATSQVTVTNLMKGANAGTATALAADPADCPAGYVATGISASGALTCTNTLSVTIDDSAAQFVGVTTDHTGKAKIDLTTSTPTKTTTLKLANADDATITFPTATSTLAILGANTFTADQTITGNVIPEAANTRTIGSSSAEWADIYLGDGAVIYGQNDQSNTLTSAATGWTVALDLTVTGGKITFGNAETIDNETDGEVKVVSPVTKMMYDADAYMSVTIANGGGATIGVTSDGADTISIGDNTDDQVRVRHVLSTTDGTWSGNSLYFAQCAATLAFGTPVYVQSTGKPAAANAAAAATMPAIGVIVVASTDADTPCTVLTHGVISADAYPTFTAGNTVYVDDSAAGVLTATVGDISGTDHVVQVMGIALNADEILVMPSLSVVTLE